MVLTSIEFIIFFVIITVFYFILPFRFRIGFLLLASYYFYSTYKIESLILLIILTFFNFLTGLLIGKENNTTRKKIILILSLFSNIFVLCWFKYVDIKTFVRFILPNYGIPNQLPSLEKILPVGLSFYTFKIMNYTIDVYRSRIMPEKKFSIFALYVSFFPQLISGPIDRATTLLPQFYKNHTFDYKGITDGMKLILWGLFQKIVIADNLAVIVDPVFNNPARYEGISLIIATLFFTFQIFCDFSGYTDIAIGTAQILGFSSMKNFDRPYFAQSIPEFWRRWHISLTSWFRDYLYIPLGGNRVSNYRRYFNVMIVFLLSGLWHGSTWTFAIWGAIHGFYYLISIITQPTRNKIAHLCNIQKFPNLHKLWKIFVTFSLVSFAWIFFRANSFSDAIYIISHLFSGWKADLNSMTFLLSSKFEFLVSCSSIVFLVIIQYIQRYGSIREGLMKKPIWLRWMIYYFAIVSILLLGNFGMKDFIYFKF